MHIKILFLCALQVPRPPGSLASAYTKQLPPKEKMFGVYVTHVHTPSCLCVQIIGETTTRTLEYLLEDLSQFYNSTGGDSYMLKKPIIGQVNRKKITKNYKIFCWLLLVLYVQLETFKREKSKKIKNCTFFSEECFSDCCCPVIYIPAP